MQRRQLSGDNAAVTRRAFRTGLRGHPRVVDAVVAALVAAAGATALTARAETTGVPLAAVDWWWTGALVVPLLWLRRAPVLVFWALLGIGTLGGVVHAHSPAGLFASLAAGYAVARYRSRRHLAPVVAAGLASLLMGGLVGAIQWPGFVAATAILAATVLLGVQRQTRQAYLAALEERAQRLERERDQLSRLAVAGERSRIAREMHDIVAHNLVVMVALADGAAATAGPHPAADVMRQVSDTGREALGEMRRLVGLLRHDPADRSPHPRGPQPGLDDIDKLVEQVRGAGVRITLTRDGEPGRWGPGAGLTVFRIVQEALTNTLKHAGPRAGAQVWLRYTADGADVQVLDDGAGRAHRATPPAGRHGLVGMRERADFYDGELTAGPRPDVGWRVHARLRFPADRGTQP